MQLFFTEKPPELPVPLGTAAVEASQPLEEAMSLAETPEARPLQTTSPVYSAAMGGWNACRREICAADAGACAAIQRDAADVWRASASTCCK